MKILLAIACLLLIACTRPRAPGRRGSTTPGRGPDRGHPSCHRRRCDGWVAPSANRQFLLRATAS